ncbi:MAG TPA: L,D-transpeptidase family protein [Thermoanaerobaculia bacterium]|nr:L,D-transpeptidase family protein [Thermoanaerobaculia bacterium]
MRRTTVGSVVLLAAVLLLPACRSAEERQAEFAAQAVAFLRAGLEEAEAPADAAAGGPERQRSWEVLTTFYEQRGYTPVWIDHEGPTEGAQGLVDALGRVHESGIDPRTYRAEELAAELAALEEANGEEGYPRRAAALDTELTYAFLVLASHLGNGRIEPTGAGIEWHTEPRDLDLAAALARAVDEGDPAAVLAELEPPHEGYRQLKQALGRYREIAAAGGWSQVPDGPPLTPGDRGQRVALLRQRLAATGEIGAAGEGEAAVYDEAVEQAVRRFQVGLGLETDGIAGPEVLGAANVPVEQRIRDIVANLERWRWLPADLGQRYVLVNVPRYEMSMVEGDRVVAQMKVVVGKEYDATPVFSDEMGYVVVNPTWNLPASIAREEVLPHLASNPGYLAANNMELVNGWGDDAEVLDPWRVGPAVWSQAGDEGQPIRLRQRPGGDNPLGDIKFMFPNEHNVYLHDTPADHLFAQADRNLSHGCIRLERPLELATWVLGEDRAEIEALIASGETREIPLPRKVPVHIQYWTAWVPEDGNLIFGDDLYGIDQRVAAAIGKEPLVRLGLELPAEVAVPEEDPEDVTGPADVEGAAPSEDPATS